MTPHVAAYRERLLPLLERWHVESWRLAVFGTGPHTDILFDAVPELEDASLVAFIETDPAHCTLPYRGRPVHGLDWADRHADVVLCSSFRNELAQLALFDGRRPKAVLSHLPEEVDGLQSGPGLFVPTEGNFVVRLPAEDRAPLAAIDRLFAVHRRAMTGLVEELARYDRGLDDVQEAPQMAPEPYWNNGYFTGDDPRLAYAVVRHLKPRRIVEVGSGHSTRFLRRGVRDAACATEIVSIDPAPRSPIGTLCDRHLATSVQVVALDVFRSLGAGDILFIDSSHLVFQSSDCAHLFLRVLPELADGVWVQVHDVFLPAGYPPEFDGRYYNEQSLLAACLIDNARWIPRLPVAWLKSLGIVALGGASFWMERV